MLTQIASSKDRRRRDRSREQRRCSTQYEHDPSSHTVAPIGPPSRRCASRSRRIAAPHGDVSCPLGGATRPTARRPTHDAMGLSAPGAVRALVGSHDVRDHGSSVFVGSSVVRPRSEHRALRTQLVVLAARRTSGRDGSKVERDGGSQEWKVASRIVTSPELPTRANAEAPVVRRAQPRPPAEVLWVVRGLGDDFVADSDHPGRRARRRQPGPNRRARTRPRRPTTTRRKPPNTRSGVGTRACDAGLRRHPPATSPERATGVSASSMIERVRSSSPRTG